MHRHYRTRCNHGKVFNRHLASGCVARYVDHCCCPRHSTKTRLYIKNVFGRSLKLGGPVEFLFFPYVRYIYYLYLPLLLLRRLKQKNIEAALVLTESVTFGSLAANFFSFLSGAPSLLRLGILPEAYAIASSRSKFRRILRVSFIRFCMRSMIPRFNSIVVDNQVIATDATRFKPHAPVIIAPPYGVNLKLFRPATSVEKRFLRGELGIPTDSQISVFLGRLAPEKGGIIPAALALSRIATERKQPMTLIIVGHGPLRAEIERSISNLPGVTVRFLGFLGEPQKISDILRAADCYLQPSLAEGHGIAPLEAMACGIPVVSTRVGGLALTVVPERAFVVDDPNGIDSYARAIDNCLYGQSSERKRIVDSAERFVAEHFDQDLVGSTWNGIIQTCAR